MKHPSTICQPSQTELRRMLAQNILPHVITWWTENPLRRSSLEGAILQGINSSMDEYEDYEGQLRDENRHSYQLTAIDQTARPNTPLVGKEIEDMRLARRQSVRPARR